MAVEKRDAEAEKRKRAVTAYSFFLLLTAFSMVGLFAIFQPGDFRQGIEVLGNGVRHGRFQTSFLILQPAITGDPGLRIRQDAKLTPGYRMYLGYFPDSGAFEARLMSPSGSILHGIPVDLSRFEHERRRENYYPHAFHPVPDGSVIVNSDKGNVMARLDACGNAMWVRRGAFHHSFAQGDDGAIWTWLAAGDEFDSADQAIVKIDPDTGETLARIDLLDDILANAGDDLLAAFGLGPTVQAMGDAFHPNDVEPLPASMAAAWPDFPPGALLLSFREPSLIAVLDPETYRILWYQNGPWLQQHDPDWSPHGDIVVLNNNWTLNSSRPNPFWQLATRSNILKVVPTENDARIEFRPAPPFATNIQGKIEILPEDRLMVVVTEQGRVFEVDENGELTADFHNRAAKGWYGRVTDAKFMTADFFDVEPGSAKC